MASCKTCEEEKLNSTNPINGMIECDICLSWVDKFCATTHDSRLKEHYAENSKKKKIPIIFWMCNACRTSFLKFRSSAMSDQNTSKDFDSMSISISEMQKTIDSLTCQLSDVKLDISSITSKIGNTSSIDSVVKCFDDFSVCSTHRLDAIEKELAALKLKYIGLSQLQNSVTKHTNPTPTGHMGTESDDCVVSKPLPSLGDTLNNLKCKQLVLGDSLVRNVRKWLPDSTYVAWRSSATITSVCKEINSALINGDIQVVILHVGGNDMINMESPDHVIGDLWSLIELIKQKFPNSKIILDGILWRRGFSYKFIHSINGGMAWLARCLRIGFADPNLSVCRNHFYFDATHLNSEGNRIFGCYLKNLLSVL